MKGESKKVGEGKEETGRRRREGVEKGGSQEEDGVALPGDSCIFSLQHSP